MKLNWSRRELEALGEPLGDCVTMPKLGGGWVCGGGGKGGGGGGPQQVTSTTTSSNIPEYARPYVENMLQSAQSQIYSDDMTTFRPYTPYSTDPSNYFAGFSPMQQQAQQAAYYMQTPGQYGLGTGLAGAAGIEALGTPSAAAGLGQEALGYGALGAQYGGLGSAQAQQAALQSQMQAGLYGGMGARFGREAAGLAPAAQTYGATAADIGLGGLGYGGRGAQAAEQGFGAGAEYARQATSPGEIQAYMSPYMQNVVDYQKAQALRDYQIGQQLRKAQAVGQGAFGGSRQAIAEAEAERGLVNQLQGIAAQGSQQAFQQAQQAQQFGANLGLQGLQAGYGGLGLGLQGIGTGLQGLQGAQAGLGQAGQLYGLGMQGAQTGLSGVGQQLAAGQLGLAGTAQGMQGAGMGLQGVGQAVGAGQYGLQGLGQATQAAQTLGQLGTQEQAAQQNIINMQSTLGAQQQALEQQKINQAIQDYATAQQYPFMQLGMLNAMLRGLPMQNMSTQQYQAAPSYLTQGLGALGTLGGAMKAFGREGGQVKGLKAGGAIKGYAPGGNVVGGIRARLETMDEAQLQNVMKTSSSEEVRKMAAEVLMEKRMADQAEQQVSRMPAPQSAGIAALPAPSMDEMAGGGIVAFAGRDESLVDEEDMVPYIRQVEKAREAAGVTGTPNQAFKEYMAQQVGALPGMKEQEKGLMMMDYFSRLGTTPGSLLYAGLTAAKETAPSMRASLDKIKKAEADVMKGQADLAQADRLEKLGLAKEAAALRKEQLDRNKALEVAKINANATMANINRPTDIDKNEKVFLAEMLAAGAPDNAATRAEARRKAVEAMGGVGQRLDVQAQTAADKAVNEDKEIKSMRLEQRQLEPGSPEHGALQQKIKDREAQIRAGYAKGTPSATPAPGAPAVQALPMPAKQEDLVKGKVYNTARGPAEWNGSAFVPVK